MRTSYGVVWREGDAPLAHGKLELLPSALRLDGISGGEPVQREIAYERLAGVHVARSPAERLNGHVALVLRLKAGEPVTLAAATQSGVVGELASRIAGLRTTHPLSVR
jgi:hypothetical protein